MKNHIKLSKLIWAATALHGLALSPQAGIFAKSSLFSLFGDSIFQEVRMHSSPQKKEHNIVANSSLVGNYVVCQRLTLACKENERSVQFFMSARSNLGMFSAGVTRSNNARKCNLSYSNNIGNVVFGGTIQQVFGGKLTLAGIFQKQVGASNIVTFFVKGAPFSTSLNSKIKFGMNFFFKKNKKSRSRSESESAVAQRARELMNKRKMNLNEYWMHRGDPMEGVYAADEAQRQLFDAAGGHQAWVDIKKEYLNEDIRKHEERFLEDKQRQEKNLIGVSRDIEILKERLEVLQQKVLIEEKLNNRLIDLHKLKYGRSNPILRAPRKR